MIVELGTHIWNPYFLYLFLFIILSYISIIVFTIYTSVFFLSLKISNKIYKKYQIKYVLFRIKNLKKDIQKGCHIRPTLILKFYTVGTILIFINLKILYCGDNTHIHKFMRAILIIFILHSKLWEKFINIHLYFIKKKLEVGGDNCPQYLSYRFVTA